MAKMDETPHAPEHSEQLKSHNSVGLHLNTSNTGPTESNEKITSSVPTLERQDCPKQSGKISMFEWSTIT